MKVFVTGGTGLVGSHAIERLVGLGHEVRALVRSADGKDFVTRLGAEPVTGTVETAESWRPADGTNAIVHAAALVTDRRSWDTYYEVNVRGTMNAVRQAARSGARLLHISSVAVYGRQPIVGLDGRVSEDTPFAPIARQDYYARSKSEAEAALWQEARREGVSAVAFRPCVIYGERERLYLSKVLRLIRLGVAPIVGTGDNRLAVVYVGNVIDALMNALERPDATGAFNVTNDGGITQREFFRTIGDAGGKALRMVHIPLWAAVGAGRVWHTANRVRRPGRYAGLGSSGGRFLARENPYTSARAERELQWRPSTPPREALYRTVRWFLEHEAARSG